MSTLPSAQVAITLNSTADGYECRPLSSTARLFLGFPLIGTERFSFPAVINSFDFTPTTNRDGVYLGRSGDEANVNNEKVVREACELHMQLVHYAAVSGCRNIHFLADIPQPTGQPGLNEHWLQEFLIGLVKEVRGTPAVLSGQCAINPEDSVIPFSEGDAAVKDLWGLLNCVKEFQPKLPSIDEATGWRNAIPKLDNCSRM